ncbi:MAG: ribose-phosphate diphosphokinase, partial [Erysipelotrichaceae bacterium]|nr:ribose-phosphate diphosphokinase [Erysipelotrichaceae bacterium]
GTAIAIVDKRRPRPNVVEAQSVIGDVNGKDCIVVDDICDTGGSLCAACQILKDHGAKDVYVALAHGVFSGNAMERIENSVIKELVVSNTIPLSEENRKKTSKITILSTGKMLAKVIGAISTDSPISEVYDLYTSKEEQTKIL